MPTLLFQGDSITDASRNRQDPHHLGTGYVYLASSTLRYRYAEQDIRIFNRGISGNRTCDLLSRWEPDCLDLQPDFLSLYIGVNNTWRRFDRQDPTPADVFAAELEKLLISALELPSLTPERTVLLEPFFLSAPIGDAAEWEADLTPKREIVQELAERYNTHFIPLQSIFNDACARAPAAYWAPDGVHPSPAGHMLIAQAWLLEMEDLLAAF